MHARGGEVRAVVNGQSVSFGRLTDAQELALASTPFDGYLLPSVSDATASALVRKGLAKEKGGRVRLLDAGCQLRARLRAQRGWQ